MYIGSIMRRELVTVAPKTTLVEARDLLDRHRIEHLLVVKGGRLVGVVSDRDLKRYWASPATALSAHELAYLLDKVTVGMIMVKTVVTAGPDTTVERAAWIMRKNEISSLPVMAGGELVGMVTATDVMGVLLAAIGMDEESRRLSLLVDDYVGQLARVTTALSGERINVQSFFCYPVPEYRGLMQVVVRVDGRDGERAANALGAAGFRVMDHYHADITPFLPEGFRP